MMTNKQPLITALLMGLLSASNLANAGTPKPPPPPPPLTVTITDARRTDASKPELIKPEPTVYHWSQYGTTLSATIANPPEPTQETTVEGPHYTWECKNSGFAVLGGDEASSPFISDPSKELTAGENDVPVTCTVTYTVTDKDTGEVTHPSATGSIDITFFVLIPVRVIQISNINAPNSPYSGPNVWGHDQLYHLQIQDNQTPPQPYGNGAAREAFTNISYGPDPAHEKIGDDPNGGKGPSPFAAGADFTDDIGLRFKENMAADYGWNVVTLGIAYDQTFTCLEPVGHPSKPLTTFHIVNDYQTSTRN